VIQGSRGKNISAVLKTSLYEILSDVSEQSGGNNSGPNPHELLEAALAACTIITIQMYANRKLWKLESTDALVKIVWEEKGLTKIDRQLTFKGDLTDEQKARLREIADKCPLHNILEGKIEIQTTVT